MQGQTPCRVCTFNVPTNSTDVIKILEADNVIEVTIQVVAGPVILQGNAAFQNSANGNGANPIGSKPISLATGSAFTFASGGPQAPIDDLTIDGTGGSCNYVMKM